MHNFGAPWFALGAALTKGKHQITPCLIDLAPARAFPSSSSQGRKDLAVALASSNLNIQY